MSLIHTLVEYARGGVSGMQASQRDWSPFVIHFTSSKAMESVNQAVQDGLEPRLIKRRLESADERSFKVVEKIARERTIRAHSPSAQGQIPANVSLSECTLPGVLAHCERYGRFGFAFNKRQVFDVGGRPCSYLDPELYGKVGTEGRVGQVGSVEHRLFAFSNKYRPRSKYSPFIQDYSHEREWRLVDDLELDEIAPKFIVAPTSYVSSIRKLFGEETVCMPINLLFRWGA